MYYTVGKHSSVVIPPGSDAITSGVYGDVEIAPSDMWIKALYDVHDQKRINFGCLDRLNRSDGGVCGLGLTYERGIMVSIPSTLVFRTHDLKMASIVNTFGAMLISLFIDTL